MEKDMRMISAAIAASLFTLLPLGAGAQEDGKKQDSTAAAACQAWDRGAAARQDGWALKELQGAERWAMLSYYDRRVGPRANPKSDGVVVATHPESPSLRVIIVRGNCIVDIGQMGPDLLDRILRNAGRPI
jgi:hypothetical protein